MVRVCVLGDVVQDKFALKFAGTIELRMMSETCRLRRLRLHQVEELHMQEFVRSTVVGVTLASDLEF